MSQGSSEGGIEMTMNVKILLCIPASSFGMAQPVLSHLPTNASILHSHLFTSHIISLISLKSSCPNKALNPLKSLKCYPSQILSSPEANTVVLISDIAIRT